MEESLTHFLLDYETLSNRRLQSLGTYQLQESELRSIRRVLVNFSFHW